MNAFTPNSPARIAASAREVPKVASEQLMRGRREIIIQHGPQEYRLRVTAAGKLILTK